MLLAGTQLDGTYRRRSRDRDVGAACFLGTFAQYGTVPETSIVKIDDDLPHSSGRADKQDANARLFHYRVPSPHPLPEGEDDEEVAR